MWLEELSKIIYIKGTGSENTNIKVKTHADKRVLWEGKARDLKNWKKIDGWIVVEVLIDFGDKTNISDHNKGKIITVT